MTFSSVSGSSMMMAWRVHEFGDPTVLKLERVPRPVAGAGEILIKVQAIGVGPWDAWIRAGKSALPQPLPLTPGSDLSGTIVALGSDVNDFRIGDEVYGVTNPRFVGAYAEYAVASSAMIAKKPSSLTHIEAASVPVVAVTAWQALIEHAELKAGQTVLIHGAAGNVGAYAVQFAHRAGIKVVATSTKADVPLVRGLGADSVIDFQSERFDEVVRDVDAVIDLVGGETQQRSFTVIRRGGKLISTVSPPDPKLAERYGVTTEFFLVDVKTCYLADIAGLIDGGKLKTNVGAIVPFEKAQEAHLMLDGILPRPNGKIVLTVSAN